MSPDKQYIVFLTEKEIKALANMYRVAVKSVGDVPYVQGLQEDGGRSANDKLLEMVKEINGDSDGQ